MTSAKRPIKIQRTKLGIQMGISNLQTTSTALHETLMRLFTTLWGEDSIINKAFSAHENCLVSVFSGLALHIGLKIHASILIMKEHLSMERFALVIDVY